MMTSPTRTISAYILLLQTSMSLSIAAFHISNNAPVRNSFNVRDHTQHHHQQQYDVSRPFIAPHLSSQSRSFTSKTKTSLPMVWWFGGSEAVDEQTDPDSCELVAVRIERTSSNSRRIYGEITVPDVTIQNVWSILTDYDQLSVHVPNLVESKIVQRTSRTGKQGDGQYQCRLYQKGAQKIIGFEFGASVTMDMKESILVAVNNNSDQTIQKINFKCYDSFFFSEFDGDWTVYERYNTMLQTMETVLSYVVDVRPKGPVPVAALEWRIREDVPTNLRAVKKAAIARQQQQEQKQLSFLPSSSSSSGGGGVVLANGYNNNNNNGKKLVQQRKASVNLARDARLKIQWYKDETMAAYLAE